MTHLQRRLAGSALAVGGAVAIVGYLAAGTLAGRTGGAHFIQPLFQPLYAIALAGTILAMLGMPAILSAQGGRFPRLTVVGYAGTLMALLMLNLGEGVIEGFVKPYLVTHGGIPKDPSGFAAWQIVGLVCAVVGLVCLGVAILRAGRLPRWIGVLLIVGLFLSFALGSQRAPVNALGDMCILAAFVGIGWREALPNRRRSSARVADRDFGSSDAALIGGSVEG